MKNRQKILFFELNEINFEYVQKYISAGKLPTFRHLISNHGLTTTISESQYEHLEPWIQWVSAHTGLPFDEHKVFRLGDITKTDIPQIWETLEERGLSVGAVSPMNAKNRCREPSFFIPDPWTNTTVVASPLLQKAYAAIRQAVNENANDQIELRSKISLALAILRYSSFARYPDYVRLFRNSQSKKWFKSIFLDVLLKDIYLSAVASTDPDFSSLFLNAGAHIQHHYFFNSSVYTGRNSNPEWLVRAQDDPILDVYSSYDQFIADAMRRFPDARILIATGLRQLPIESPVYYWRLKDHQSFIDKLVNARTRVEPRMSRDFVVICDDMESASSVATALTHVVDAQGQGIFDVDNRGGDLFVTLIHKEDISKETRFFINQAGGRKVIAGESDFSFVALKNGYHDGLGYFIDTGVSKPNSIPEFPISDLPSIIQAAFHA